MLKQLHRSWHHSGMWAEQAMAGLRHLPVAEQMKKTIEKTLSPAEMAKVSPMIDRVVADCQDCRAKHEVDAQPVEDHHGISWVRTQYHSAWVTKVGFIQELQYMVTSGLDGLICKCEMPKNRMREQRPGVPEPPVDLHRRKGVLSWCWCPDLQFIASCGLDRQVIVWNPYTLRVMNWLQAHNAAVHTVLMNEDAHQLLSVGVDNVVKVW